MLINSIKISNLLSSNISIRLPLDNLVNPSAFFKRPQLSQPQHETINIFQTRTLPNLWTLKRLSWSFSRSLVVRQNIRQVQPLWGANTTSSHPVSPAKWSALDLSFGFHILSPMYLHGSGSQSLLRGPLVVTRSAQAVRDALEDF